MITILSHESKHSHDHFCFIWVYSSDIIETSLFAYHKSALSYFEMRHLSMGMSGDYEVAIEEGATIVRVGSAIFGSSPCPRSGTARNTGVSGRNSRNLISHPASTAVTVNCSRKIKRTASAILIPPVAAACGQRVC